MVAPDQSAATHDGSVIRRYLDGVSGDRYAARDAALVALERLERRLLRQVAFHKEFRERARAAEQVLALYVPEFLRDA